MRVGLASEMRSGRFSIASIFVYDELQALNYIKEEEAEGHVARRRAINTFNILVERKRKLGRTRRIWQLI
jgi:hypothetical protein